MHLFLLSSIFDIYFTSPIIPHIQPIQVSHKPLADRLVLYVIDGLRANKLFNNHMETTSFLKKIMKEGNSWGLSNTRVPTETRPGHVALIAGFYEDVSSITKGWQENAVEFDSLFNRSTTTWSWGSPDVLPMFQRGAIKNRIHTFCYQSELEDFAGNRTWELDTWVFDEVTKFFNKAVNDSELDKQIRRGGVVFFLHLLGIDVSGHSQKPHSQLYSKNLQIVSEGIENMTNLFNSYFKDNKTAFIVTSDHGMTDWGSHGAGSVDETATPVIAWGSGLFNSKYSRNKLKHFSSLNISSSIEISSDMSQSFQQDIMQADICVLMASLLGIPIPINSVGVVPIDYIEASDATKLDILRTNIFQLFVQYEMKYIQKKESSLFHFQEYEKLPIEVANKELEICDQLIARKDYLSAIEKYQSLSLRILDGITYFHRYDRVWLGFLFALSFILWILFLGTHIVHPLTINKYPCKMQHYTVLSIFLLMSFIYTSVEQQPYSYLLYQIVPIVLTWFLYVFKKYQIQYLFKLIEKNYLFFFGVIILVESIVWSFFYRQILSVGLVVTYLIVLKTSFSMINMGMKIKWTLVCAILMIYPNLPVIAGNNSRVLVFIGGLLNCFLSAKMLFWNKPNLVSTKTVDILKCFLMFLVIFTIFHVSYCQSNIQSGNGLSIYSQFLNWLIFLSLIPLICCLCMEIKTRIQCFLVALAIVYNLLSIYYELIFFFSLTIFALIWMEIESTYRSENISCSNIDRRKIIQTAIFVFLLTYTFFATGNIASLNSFDVVSTFCLLTIFKPFLMGFILITKIMIPMITISLAYVFIQHKQTENIRFSSITDNSVNSQFNIEEICLVTIISDFAALHFLFMIKDSGSWLEIGTSISNYVITMGISIGAFLFTILAKYLLTVNSVFAQFVEFKSK